MTIKKKTAAPLALSVLLCLFALASPLAAQNRGQYLLGTNGLNSGVVPEPRPPRPPRLSPRPLR